MALCVALQADGTLVPTGQAVGERKDGSRVTFNEQTAAIDKGEDFPSAFTINLADDQPPFPEGRYLLDPACLEVGDVKSLKVGRRIALIPVPEKGSPSGKA